MTVSKMESTTKQKADELDKQVREWLDSLGWRHSPRPNKGYSIATNMSTCLDSIHDDTARQLYLNPPLGSPAVRRAVLEARIDEAKMWAIGCGSRWSKRIRDEFIEKELTLMKECKLLTQLQADRLAELEKQLKELEEMK